jgi:CRP-like cAMP-binding protein
MLRGSSVERFVYNANVEWNGRAQTMVDDPAPTLEFDGGETIFVDGDPAHWAYIIQEGAVEISVEREGRSTVIDTLEVGEIFGEMALFDDSPRSATARAKLPTKCLLVSKGVLEDQLEKASLLMRAMSGLLVKRLRRTTDRID